MATSTSAAERRKVIARLGARLSSSGYPRLGLLLSITFAACTGFLSSAGMLALGVHAPAVRYVLALIIAYVTLLILLRVWLLRRHFDGHWDLPLEVAKNGPFEGAPASLDGGGGFGGGGGFSGGGSSSSFGTADAAVSKSDSGGTALDVAGDADEGTVVIGAILLAIAILVGLGATYTVVTNAPVLLAEVVLDGTIATAAYRRMRLSSPTHWVHGVFKRTWKPLAAILVALLMLGIAIPLLVPGGDSIGDLIRSSRAR